MTEAYKLARVEAEGNCNDNFDGEWIWRVPTIPKIKCYLWQCYHKSIPISSLLAARGMDIPTVCWLCNSGSETILHVLRDCQVARNLWIALSPPLPAVSFFSLQLTDWLRLNYCSTKTMATSNVSWSILFGFGIWTLWSHWNGVLFWNERNQSDLKHEVLAKANEFVYIEINGKLTISRRIIRVSWLKPPMSWYKLNPDGLLLGNPRRAGGGGLICNDKGEWIRGYARAVRHTTSVATELWALRDGIKLCISLKLPAVILELDAKLIVDLLQKEDYNQNSIDALVSDCKSSLREIPLVQIHHCYREANKCADVLARRGALLPQDFVVFFDPLVDVTLLLSLDSTGMFYERSVSTV